MNPTIWLKITLENGGGVELRGEGASKNFELEVAHRHSSLFFKQHILCFSSHVCMMHFDLK